MKNQRARHAHFWECCPSSFREYRRRETGAVLNDLLWNHQQSSHATLEDRAGGSTLDIVSQPWKSPRQTWGRWGMDVGDRVGAYSVTGLTGLQTMLR